MTEFFLSGLRSGLRGRSFHAVILMGLALVGIAYLSGSFSPRQPRTVALDIGLSGIRFTLVLLALFWIQDLLAREIDRKTILFSLSYPVSRTAFLLGRYFAVLALTALAVLVLGLVLLPAVIFAGGGYWQDTPVGLGLPYWLTLAGMLVDIAVVAAFAFLIAAVSTVSVMPLAVGAAFAVAGKAMGATLDYMARGFDGDRELMDRVGPFIEMIRWFVPDLSRLDWRDWPMYNLAPSTSALFWSVSMAVSYIVILLCVTSWHFGRREFS